jgi:hypothetical protein
VETKSKEVWGLRGRHCAKEEEGDVRRMGDR